MVAVTTPAANKSGVRYVFDPAKNGVNRAKHGDFLALAETLFAGAAHNGRR
jgi:hypothetical protein